jgi:choline transporter-like protein 2/4/5
VLILVFGFIVAAIMGFVALRLIRLPFMLEFIIWGCIGGVFAFCFGIGIMLKYVTAAAWAAEDPPLHSSAEIAGVSGMGYFFLGLAALWFCIICCLRARIFLAIGITKEAAKALGAMTSLILFPVVQTAGIIAFTMVWGVYMLYLASSGDIVKETYIYNGYEFESKSYVYSDNSKKAYWYLLFCWFWTSEFIMAMGQIVTALSVSIWYFTREDKKSTIGSSTVVTSVWMAFRYHTGTAAFGSLIIAIIKTIRAFISYLQKNADRLAARGGKAAQTLAKIILCALQCCMWCIEKCAKFLNKHAYIQVAIFSYSFCKAARCAFFLILRNILLIGAVSIVSEFVLALILAFIPITTTFIAYCVFSSMEQLNSVFGVTMFTFFLSYFTATKFVETFGMVICTILQCYVADTELNAPEDRYAGGSLKSSVANSNAAAKKQPKTGKVAPAPAGEEPAKAEEAPAAAP